MKKTKFSYNSGDIERYISDFIWNRKDQFKDAFCIDAPAGQGVTSEVLKLAGANVEAFDLFPEYFKVDGVSCRRADMAKNIPVHDGKADWFICQEGFEHFHNQFSVFKEINRVLKIGGRLIITVPNYSNLKAKMSYLFFESECMGRDMPPNEIDTIWHASDADTDNEIYFGHAFLVGIQRLIFMAKLNGFSLIQNHKTKINKTSLFFFFFLYPFILFYSYRTYFYACNKKKGDAALDYKRTYRELVKYNIDPSVLLCKNLFLEFEKTDSLTSARTNIIKGKELSPWETVSNKQIVSADQN